MKLSEIESKDVVNVINGSKLGKVIDLEVNIESGKIEKLIVANQLRFSSFFNSNNNVVILFEDIIKVGKEVIIVNHSQTYK